MRDDQNEHAHRHGENQSADIYKKVKYPQVTQKAKRMYVYQPKN